MNTGVNPAMDNTAQSRAAARRALFAGAALLIVLRSGTLQAAAADDLQPGVQTSAAAAPVAATAVAGPKGAVQPAAGKPTAAQPSAQPSGQPSGKAPTRSAPKGAEPAAGASTGARPGGAHDRVELDTTQITGNRELPNVMYVVPWKKPELGDFGGRPPKSLLDELLAPVDRDVFRRQNRYYSALKAGAAAGQGAAVGTGAGGAAAGSGPAAPATPNSVPNAVDEK